MKILNTLTAAMAVTMLVSCGTPSTAPEKNDSTASAAPTPVKTTVLSAEEQAALTPDKVLQIMKDGNDRFVNNQITARDHSSMIREAAGGQFPKAVVLSCLDSRVPVEDVFDLGIGDIFVGRVAGNFVNEDLLGSMEFGTKVAGAKLIFVLGHESCGAVMSAIDDVKLGNITAMLSKIRPAVAASQSFEGDKTSSNVAFVDEVAVKNVKLTMENITKNSPILKELVDKGAVKIAGGYYSMKTGKVTFL